MEERTRAPYFDLRRYEKLLKKAAENGEVDALVELGDIYVRGRTKDYAKAVRCYLEAANIDYAPAQDKMGIMYRDGLGVERDYKQALYWFDQAAGQGYTKSQSRIGQMYDSGKGVEKDYQKASEWYRLAAENGDFVGQYLLGCMYECGEGVEKDVTEAAYYYRLSAEQGYKEAQRKMSQWMIGNVNAHEKMSHVLVNL